VALQSIPFAGQELLEERATPKGGQSSNTAREDLLQLRREISSNMRSLQNPPPEYADAYTQLVAMYETYEEIASMLLDKAEPEPLPDVEAELLLQRFDHLRKAMASVSPAKR
jgi:hypothetical protein